MNVSIIGSGVYAKAISALLLASSCKVTMWTEKKDFKEILAKKEVKLTTSFEEATSSADVIFVLTSSKYVRGCLQGIAPTLSPSTVVVLGSKGILKDGTLMTDILEEIMPEVPYAVLSGPTFATDIAALEPIGFTLATSSRDIFAKVASCLNKVNLEYFEDTVAVEMCGSLKNAYAIGSGILNGVGYGPSTVCLYITKVLKEIGNIFKARNLNIEVLNTLAGVGDLVLTCTSVNSRNYTFGTILASHDENLVEQYLSTNTVEGFENLQAYIVLFKKLNIKAPIMESLANIIKDNENTNKLVSTILESK